MKKLLILLSLAAVVMFAGCAENALLHNIDAAVYTFELVNFPADDGDYAIPGDFNGWNNGDGEGGVPITLTDGAGTSEEVNITVSTFIFSITELGTYNRPWYPATEGNSVDGFSGDSWNFQIEDLVLGTRGTITIDGSTVPATITVSN
ncbi:hypothetical protein [Salinispira pacifica]|nr:hypothetical protein [Salinispira pacifica]